MPKRTHTQMTPSEWRASTSMAGLYALRMLGMFLVLPVLALHAHSMSQDMRMVGLAMAMYGLTQALLQLPLGVLSDKWGRKKVIYLGMSVFALGSFMAAFAQSVEMLIIARAIQGAGAVSAAVTALLADLTRDEVRTRAMSMIGLSIGLTFAVSLVLSPILTQFIGVNGLFVLMGVLSLSSLAVVHWFTPNPVAMRFHEDAQMQPARLMEALKSRPLMRLNYGIFALQAGLMAIFTTLPFALRELGWAKLDHWKVYLPAAILGLVLMVPAIIVGETRNKLKQVFVAGIVLVLFAQAALMLSTHSVWAIGVCLVVYFVGFNILEASLPSMVSKIAPSDLKGTAMGIYNTMQSLGVFAGGLIGSKMYALAAFNGVFGFCCVIVLVWLVLAVLSPAPRPVKNVMFGVPKQHHSSLDKLSGSLKAVAGVEMVSFSADGQTVFIKALQHGFDEEKVQQILMGA